MKDEETRNAEVPVIIVPMDFSFASLVSEMVASVIQSLEYYNDWARKEEIAKYSSDNLLDHIKHDPDAVLLAKVDEKVAGFCISRFDDGLIWLSWFGVKKEYRGRGIGEKLLEALELSVPRRGAHKIWCDSRTSNAVSAIALQKAGYKKIATLSNHWYGQDFFLWEKHPK